MVREHAATAAACPALAPGRRSLARFTARLGLTRTRPPPNTSVNTTNAARRACPPVQRANPNVPFGVSQTPPGEARRMCSEQGALTQWRCQACRAPHRVKPTLWRQGGWIRGMGEDVSPRARSCCCFRIKQRTLKGTRRVASSSFAKTK